jgi:hypothetical protein
MATLLNNNFTELITISRQRLPPPPLTCGDGDLGGSFCTVEVLLEVEAQHALPLLQSWQVELNHLFWKEGGKGEKEREM